MLTPSLHIGTLLERNARHYPDKTAFVCGLQRFSYSELQANVNRCGSMLAELGLRKGDAVATFLPNSVELVEVYWSAAALGLVVVPVSTLMQGAGLATMLNDSDAVLIVTTQELMPVLEAILPSLENVRHILVTNQDTAEASQIGECRVESYHRRLHQSQDVPKADIPNRIAIKPETPYNIMYSSGTTGLPKGIVLTHGIRALYCTMFANAFRIYHNSVILHGGSIVFNGSFLTFMPWMYLGATYFLMEKFSPEEFIAIVERERVTHVMMVPSQIVAVLHSPAFAAEKLASLEVLGSVGAPLLIEHKELLHKVLPGRFFELYGLTEGFMTVLDNADALRKQGSVGAPVPFYAMRIVREDGSECSAGEIGEITGRGPMLMPGYHKRPDLTADAIRDGWLYTGDMGFVDEDGFLFLADRKKDMIITGGVNVYPRDIEEIAVRLPAVRDVAVFGVPHAEWGESPVAAVVLEAGIDALSEDIKRLINEHVSAKFQRVSDVVILEELPRNVAGKTLKRELRERYVQEHST